MKFKMLFLIPITAIGFNNFNSFAQEKKEKTRIVIKSDNNGKVTTKEMSFDKKMTQAEIDKLMAENMIDSSQNKVIKKNKKVTVTVDENGHVNRNIEESDTSDFDDLNEVNSFGRRNYQFRAPKISKEDFRRRGKNFIDEIPYRVQRADDFFIETFNSDDQIAIKNAEIFSNNPRSEFINIKFRVTKKEKITLTLVDLNGKIVAQDSILDFAGDYFGQMKVDKSLKGNFFLIIAQADEGESVPVFLK